MRSASRPCYDHEPPGKGSLPQGQSMKRRLLTDLRTMPRERSERSRMHQHKGEAIMIDEDQITDPPFWLVLIALIPVAILMGVLWWSVRP